VRYLHIIVVTEATPVQDRASRTVHRTSTLSSSTMYVID